MGTCKTPAFGWISLALRGSRPFGAPVNKTNKNWGTGGAPLEAAAYAAFGSNEKNWGACGASNAFKNLTQSMMIPNMCLVLILDYGKVGTDR